MRLADFQPTLKQETRVSPIETQINRLKFGLANVLYSLSLSVLSRFPLAADGDKQASVLTQHGFPIVAGQAYG